VSVDPLGASRRLRDRLSARFIFLSDPSAELLDALGIRHPGGKDGSDIAYPTSMLVDADGKVRWIYQSDSYRQRARAEEVLAALAALVGSGL
jgi:peroxiredoxin